MRDKATYTRSLPLKLIGQVVAVVDGGIGGREVGVLPQGFLCQALFLDFLVILRDDPGNLGSRLTILLRGAPSCGVADGGAPHVTQVHAHRGDVEAHVTKVHHPLIEEVMNLDHLARCAWSLPVHRNNHLVIDLLCTFIHYCEAT